MRIQTIIAAAALAAGSLSANAQSLKPGLWEVRSNVQAGGEDMAKDMTRMQQEIAAMPPEQRKMMQEMMTRQGVSVGGGGMATGTRICVTREMAQHNEVPADKSDCKQTVSPRAGNTMKFSVTCTNPPSTGEGQITFNSPESYTSRMTMTTVERGKPQKVNVESAGKWISADCGTVKPAGAAKR
jgi:hypothetical protein